MAVDYARKYLALRLPTSCFHQQIVNPCQSPRDVRIERFLMIRVIRQG
jgi:hypothetical protein